MPSFDVGQTDEYLSIESTGSQQSRIEHVDPVRGRHHDNIGLRAIEAVHFDEQLIERVLLFAVAAEIASAAFATDRVDLVDEQNARRVLACHGKHVTDLNAKQTRNKRET